MHALLITNILAKVGEIALAVGILLAMVTVHEFGHYVVGKLLGFKINEFAVGFGPAIFKKRSKKTGELFAVRVIPLGGYCAFDGEDYDEDDIRKDAEPEEPFSEMNADVKAEENAEIEEKDGSRYALNEETRLDTSNEKDEYPEPQGVRFNEQAPWKRILVLIAGATMNYLLALLVIICMFAFRGRPLYRVVDKAELETGQATIVTEDTDVLQVGDVILKIEGRNLYLVTDYMDAIEGKKAGDTVRVRVIRNGEEKDVSMTLAVDADFVNMADTGKLLHAMNVDGLYVQMHHQGFFQTIGNSIGYSVKIGGAVLRSLGELLTGKIGMESVGGPITTITCINSHTARTANGENTFFLGVEVDHLLALEQTEVKRRRTEKSDFFINGEHRLDGRMRDVV